MPYTGLRHWTGNSFLPQCPKQGNIISCESVLDRHLISCESVNRVLPA